jgi:hypothetical protein
MAKDGAGIHAMKMGVQRREARTDAMNMAWTGTAPCEMVRLA